MSKIQKLLSVAEAMTTLAESLKDLAVAVSENAPANTTEPVKTATKEKAKAAEKPAPRAVTMEEVRAVLAEKSRNGQAEGVRELLQRYGCSKLSDVNPDDYAALMAHAEVLGDAE